MEPTELENGLRNILQSIRILWSTLEAVHDAMRGQDSTLETYQDAVYGAANAAYRLKLEMEDMIGLWVQSSGNTD